MDPQKLSQLDPKLREAYQRVMGTPTQAQNPIPTPPIPDPTPVPTPIPQPTPTPTPPMEEPTSPIQPPPPPTMPEPPQPAIQPEPVSEPQPAIPQPEPAIPPTPPAQANNFVEMNSGVAAAPAQNFSMPAPQAQTVALKKKSGIMMPILFGIVGLVFIVIYIFFWTKIFNFKLPFLP